MPNATLRISSPRGRGFFLLSLRDPDDDLFCEGASSATGVGFLGEPTVDGWLVMTAHFAWRCISAGGVSHQVVWFVYNPLADQIAYADDSGGTVTPGGVPNLVWHRSP